MAGVIGLLGQDLAHAAARIRRISRVAWDKMDVDMEDTLPRSFININPDVVTIRIKFIVDGSTFLRHQLHTSGYLFGGEVEETCAMTQRHNQRMAATHRIGVARAVG